MEQINENNTVTMHQAELYLRNKDNPTSLYVRIGGKRRRLFINRCTGLIGIIAIGKRNRGYRFSNWESIEKISGPRFDVYSMTGHCSANQEKMEILASIRQSVYRKLSIIGNMINLLFTILLIFNLTRLIVAIFELMEKQIIGLSMY